MQNVDYYKDTRTGAIINESDAEYKRILAMRESSKRDKEIYIRLNSIEKEVLHIKELLIQFIDREKE